MKNKFLCLILAVCLIVPFTFAFAGCGDKRVKLEGKSIVFDRVEDIQWDATGLHLFKVIDGVDYEALLTTEEFVNRFYNSQAFARGLGSDTNFTTLEQAKDALRNIAFGLYRDAYPNFRISEDGLPATQYDWSDTSFTHPITTYQVIRRNTEFGYAYEMPTQNGEGIKIIHSEPNYIRYSAVMEGKSIFLTDFSNESIIMKTANGGTREVKLASFPENSEGGFQFMFFVNGNNYYKIVD